MKLDLRIKVKATNAHLARLAERFGTVKAIADELGVSAATYSAWMNFRSRPTDRRWSAKQKKVLLRLCELCGERLETIFPDITEDEREILCRTRQYDVTTDTVALSESRTEHLTYELDTSGPEKEETKEAIKKVLKTLSLRERTIVEMRYGLNGEPPKTLDEVAFALMVTRERVRQIEAKAIRRLQQPSRSSQLLSVLDGTVIKSPAIRCTATGRTTERERSND